MTETRKVLGQAALAITTLTDVYTVPAATQAVVSGITICNRDVGAAAFRLAIAVAGAGDDPKQYLCYDIALTGNAVYTYPKSITLGAADVVRVYASTANLTAQVFGVEIA